MPRVFTTETVQATEFYIPAFFMESQRLEAECVHEGALAATRKRLLLCGVYEF